MIYLICLFFLILCLLLYYYFLRHESFRNYTWNSVDGTVAMKTYPSHDPFTDDQKKYWITRMQNQSSSATNPWDEFVDTEGRRLSEQFQYKITFLIGQQCNMSIQIALEYKVMSSSTAVLVSPTQTFIVSGKTNSIQDILLNDLHSHNIDSFTSVTIINTSSSNTICNGIFLSKSSLENSSVVSTYVCLGTYPLVIDSQWNRYHKLSCVKSIQTTIPPVVYDTTRSIFLSFFVDELQGLNPTSTVKLLFQNRMNASDVVLQTTLQNVSPKTNYTYEATLPFTGMNPNEYWITAQMENGLPNNCYIQLKSIIIRDNNAGIYRFSPSTIVLNNNIPIQLSTTTSLFLPSRNTLLYNSSCVAYFVEIQPHQILPILQSSYEKTIPIHFMTNYSGLIVTGTLFFISVGVLQIDISPNIFSLLLSSTGFVITYGTFQYTINMTITANTYVFYCIQCSSNRIQITIQRNTESIVTYTPTFSSSSSFSQPQKITVKHENDGSFMLYKTDVQMNVADSVVITTPSKLTIPEPFYAYRRSDFLYDGSSPIIKTNLPMPFYLHNCSFTIRFSWISLPTESGEIGLFTFGNVSICLTVQVNPYHAIFSWKNIPQNTYFTLMDFNQSTGAVEAFQINVTGLNHRLFFTIYKNGMVVTNKRDTIVNDDPIHEVSVKNERATLNFKCVGYLFTNRAISPSLLNANFSNILSSSPVLPITVPLSPSELWVSVNDT